MREPSSCHWQVRLLRKPNLQQFRLGCLHHGFIRRPLNLFIIHDFSYSCMQNPHLTYFILHSQSPSTYQRLSVPKRPCCRLSCVRYLPPEGQYTLASSDRHAVYLWDTRRGCTSAVELTGPDVLTSSVEVLSGGQLVCAVTSQQQVRGGRFWERHTTCQLYCSSGVVCYIAQTSRGPTGKPRP
jgi:WD40 repeat protein